ncbi:MAG: ATP-binding protein [Azospira sp.]|jgi:PAS domain S-box-containing protein|nr:ATP-binding protein [Azospira sp.]
MNGPAESRLDPRPGTRGAATEGPDDRPGLVIRSFPLLVFLLSLAMTLLVFQHARHRNQLEWQTLAARDAALIAAELRQALDRPAQQLRAIQAFHAAGATVGEAEWSRLSRRLRLDRPLPGIIAYGYAPRLDRESAEGTRYTFPVRYGAPRGALPATLDLYAERRRAEAIDLARDRDDVVLTRLLSLHELLGAEESGGGLMMILPVYDGPPPAVDTVDSRRHSLAGVAFAIIDIDALLTALHSVGGSPLMLRVFDDESFNSADAAAAPRLLHEPPVIGEIVERREVEFGQRNWQLQFVSDKDSPYHREAFALLVAGLIVSVLLGAAARMQTTHRKRVERQAAEITRELRLSEERFQLAAEGANDGLWDLDMTDGSVWRSERLKTMLGYPHDAGNRSDFFLACIHPDDRGKFDAALARHFDAGTPFRIEYRFLHGNGGWIWLHSHGQGVRDAAGKPLRLVGSTADVTERKQAEAELLLHRDRLREMVEERTADLLQAKDAAERANEAKSGFLANMSHELRTPLHSVLSFASLGEERAQASDQPKLAHYFARIHQSGSRLLGLVNDLLDLSKLEAGKMHIEPVVQDVQPILHDTLAEFEPVALAQRQHLEIHVATPDTRAAVDADRLAQVIRNVVSNALRFSPPESLIHIELADGSLSHGRRATDAGEVAALQISVRDTGPGIPDGELESIFEKFRQSSWTSNGAGGTGLGLSICREIMQAHRGSIRACNNLQGGATFSVLLPREIAASPRGNRQ